MYTFEPPILYSEDALRGVLLRSTPNLNKFNLFVPESTVPLGFCFGGFSSTAGYVSGNEAQRPKTRATFALIWLIISKERYPFLSEQLDRSENRPSKPFGFNSERS
jgi:hypothetical protein